MASHNTAAMISEEQPKIVLYWLDKSRSQRILWLLEELKLPYELKIFHRQPNMRAPPELKKIHPLGKSPVLSITPAGSDVPVVIAESGLITEYLIEHFGQNTTLLPTHWKDGQEGKVGGETEAWIRYKYYLHYAEGSLMPFFLVSLLALTLKNSPTWFFIKPVTAGISNRLISTFAEPNLITHFGFLEDQLKTSSPAGTEAPYLCGPHLTGADILLSFPLIAGKGRTASLTEERFPMLWNYILRLEKEPGYLKAVEKIVEIDGSFSTSF